MKRANNTGESYVPSEFDEYQGTSILFGEKDGKSKGEKVRRRGDRVNLDTCLWYLWWEWGGRDDQGSIVVRLLMVPSCSQTVRRGLTKFCCWESDWWLTERSQYSMARSSSSTPIATMNTLRMIQMSRTDTSWRVGSKAAKIYWIMINSYSMTIVQNYDHSWMGWSSCPCAAERRGSLERDISSGAR